MRKPIGGKGYCGGVPFGQHKFEVEQADQLQYGHAHDQSAAQLPADAQNVEQQQEVQDAEKRVQRHAKEGFGFQPEGPVGPQEDRRKRHDRHGGGHQQFATPVALCEIKRNGHNKGQHNATKNK